MRRRKDDLIVRCMVDMVLPLTLVYGFYVILHGHLSPGGGFQGGTVLAVAVLLIFLGYGKTGAENINGRFLSRTEPVALVVYICLSLAGIFVGVNFCTNFYYNNGSIGALFSSGIIANMDEAVGYNVATGVGTLLLLMIGLLPADLEETKGGDEK